MLFVIEEVIGRWTAGILGAVVLSAISSTVVERWFLGQEPLFRVPEYHLEHPGELIAYAALGVLGGIASVVFVKFIALLRPMAAAPAIVDAIPATGGGRAADRVDRHPLSASHGRRLQLN